MSTTETITKVIKVFESSCMNIHNRLMYYWYKFDNLIRGKGGKSDVSKKRREI